MIRQIWKVRNTRDGPAQKPSPATEKATGARQAIPNDERPQEGQMAAQGGAADFTSQQPQESDELKFWEPKVLYAKAGDAPLSVCTYNPRSAMVYALVQKGAAKGSDAALDQAAAQEESKEGAPPTTKAHPGILQVPAALTAGRASAGAELSEGQKGAPAGSQPAQMHPDGSGGDPSDFSSLQDKQAFVSLHDPFAFVKAAKGAESSNQRTGAQKATCLRFSPTLSSENIVITDNGFTTYATKTVGKGEMSSNAVIGSIGFNEGVHYWEIICPIFCNSIDFGVTSDPKNLTKQNTISEQFFSTTKRTVGIELNLVQGQVSYWLNGRMQKKNKIKKMPKVGLTWYPYIRLQEPNIPATLNPFCQLPMADTTAQKFRKKFPQSISNQGMSHASVTFLKQKLENTFMLIELAKQDDAQLEQYIRAISPETPLKSVHLMISDPNKEEVNKRAAVLTFENKETAAAFVNVASRKQIHLLDSEIIAKMLLTRFAVGFQTKSALGFDNCSVKVLQQALAQYGEQLAQLTLGHENIDKIMLDLGYFTESAQGPSPEPLLASLKERLASGEEASQAAGDADGESLYQVSYLKNTDKMLVTRGPYAKVFAAEETERRPCDMALFANFPTEPTDEVYLSLSRKDLDIILKHLPLQTQSQHHSIVSKLIKAIHDTYVSGRVRIEYFTALQSVNVFKQTTVELYKDCEMAGTQIVIKDISQLNEVPSVTQANGLSYREVNRLMNILLGIEEQLWAMSQGPLVSQSVKDLWPKQVARSYSALQRLTSMASFHDSEQPLALAELGLLNYEGENKKIRHFQDYNVPLENIYEGRIDLSSKNELQVALQKQLPANYLLKGLHTWNVTLAQTINSLPPVLQRDFIPKTEKVIEPSLASIDTIKSLAESSFVMTCSKRTASVNVWSSALGLNLAGGFNFFEQVFRKDSENELYMKDFVKVHEDSETIILVSKKLAASGLVKKMGNKLNDGAQEAEQESNILQVPKDQPKANDASFESTGLGNLFDEQEDAAVLIESDNSESEREDEDEGLSFYNAWFGSKERKEEEKEKKAPTPKDEVIKIGEEKDYKVNREKLHQELIMMGFPIKKIDKAFENSKSTQLNEMIDAILKDLSPVEPEEIIVEPVKDSYNSYTCSVCTFINKQNPAGTCQICGSNAPESALVKVKPAKPEDAAQKAAAQEKAGDQSAQADQENEDQKMAQEQKLRDMKALEDQQLVRSYYEDSQIIDFLLATNKKGQSKWALTAAAALFNAQAKSLDLHFIDFKYRRSYIKRVTGKNHEDDFEGKLSAHQMALEFIQPSLDELVRYNSSDRKMSKELRILRASRLCVTKLSYSQVDQIVQLGDNIDLGLPVFILVTGKNASEEMEPKMTILSINCQGLVQVVSDSNLVEFTLLESKIDIFASQIESGAGPQPRLLVRKDDKLKILKVSLGTATVLNFEEERCVSLSADEKILQESNGLVLIENSATGSFRSVFVDPVQESKVLGGSNLSTADETSAQASEQSIPESKILEMVIDPENVTQEGLDRYETLMKGKIAKATSNANYRSGRDSGQSSDSCSVHTWRNDSQRHNRVIGAFEMRFEKPTSLVSLNLDISLECQDSAKLLSQLKSDDSTDNAKSQQLGISSLKGFKEDSPLSQKDESDKSAAKDNFLPLVVERNKQASYNNSFIASRMLVDNDKMFASNYPKPQITFAHQAGEQMTVQSITIRVPQNTKTGVYPMGEGLIFLSDTLQAFEMANMFRNFELQHYTQWKEERAKDPRPLRACEPVAFFQLDANQTVSFEIEHQRAAKYILLLPTAFRKKPVKLSQNPDFVPMEIQFFGAVGTTQKVNVLDCVEVNDCSQNMLQEVHSEYDCEVRVLGSDETISLVQNFRINQLRVVENSVSPQTIISLPQAVAEKLKFEGLSLIRINDSSLHLQKIAGVSVTLRSVKADNEATLWRFQSANIQGLEATLNKGQPVNDESMDVIFGNSEIPSNYYRSCLLSPRYFSVINKHIVKICYDSKFDLRLRLRVLTFLQNIIRTDNQFCTLVLQELNLKQFIETNVLGQSSATISLVNEFLKSFQSEQEFAQILYEIIIGIVSDLPDTYMSQNSNDAIIGMLKWALPLNYQRTFEVLTRNLYQKVTLEKVAKAQTSELVEFRTRIAPNLPFKNVYPFDNMQFVGASSSSESQDANKKKETQQSKGSRLITLLSLTQHKPSTVFTGDTSLNRSYSVSFQAEVELQMFKIYFEQTSGLFSLGVKVVNKNDKSLVFQKVYPPHTVAQFSDHTIYNSKKELVDHALSVGNLSHKCSDLLITFTFYGSTIDKSPTPNCYIEFYGKMDEAKEAEATKKYNQMLDSLIPPNESGKRAMIRFQSSAQFYKSKTGGVFIPYNEPNDSQGLDFQEPAQVPGQEEAKLDNEAKQIETGEKSAKKEENKSHAVALKLEEIRKLQEVLKVDLAASSNQCDFEGLEIVACNIYALQKEISALYEPKRGDPMEPERFSAYLVSHASDLTKLIKYTLKNGKLENDAVRESISKVYNEAHGSSEADLSAFALTLFEKYVVNESGSGVQDMITFVKECLIPILNQEERKNFYRELLSRFLKTPQKHISQLSVIQAATQLEIPSGDLIGYLAELLGYDSSTNQIGDVSENPISILTGVCVLNMASIKALEQTPIKSEPKETGTSGLTFDNVLKIVFAINSWVSSNKGGFFSDSQRITLLKLSMTNLQLTTMHATPGAFLDIMIDKVTVQTFLLELLSLNDKDLMKIYYQFLSPMIQRLVTEFRNAKPGELPIPNELRQVFLQIIEKAQVIIYETFDCLVSAETNTSSQEAQAVQKVPGIDRLIAQCKKDKDRFIKLLEFLERNYFGNVISINKLDDVFAKWDQEKSKQEKPSSGESPESKEPKLIDTSLAGSSGEPKKEEEKKADGVGAASKQPSPARSDVSIYMIKSLMKLLNRDTSEVERSAFENDNEFRDRCQEFTTKQLQSLWKITLETLKSETVAVEQLVDSNVLEDLIEAFLSSVEEIKQSTFMQILNIAKNTTSAAKDGKLVCKLLFRVLKSTDWKSSNPQNVGYHICEGLLDILIHGVFQEIPSKGDITSVTCKVDVHEASELLSGASQFLAGYLNIGNFEGVSGAQQHVVLKLEIAHRMITVLSFAEDKSGNKVLRQVLDKCQDNGEIRRQLENSMDNLLLWIFLSGRLSTEEQYLQSLQNPSLQTSATYLVKEITNKAKNILIGVGDCIKSSEAIKVALKSLVNIVKAVNKRLLTNSTAETMGFDSALRLSKRSNTLFAELLESWLVSDTTINYFCFDLCGFAFLLDTVGDKSAKASSEETKQDQHSIEEQKGQNDLLAISDLNSIFNQSSTHQNFIQSITSEPKGKDDKEQAIKSAMETLRQRMESIAESKNGKSADEKDSKDNEEAHFSIPCQELGKNMLLKETSTKDQTSTYQRVDWTANKRVYRHKVYTKQKAGSQQLEFSMLFQLESPALIREIQIAFINFWQIENEVFLEPLTVVVSAGLDEKYLTEVCTLELIKDNAFTSVHATIFGKNMLQFKDERGRMIQSGVSGPIEQQIEDVVRQKLDSLTNFKAQYLEFSMRRNVLTSLELGPLSTRIMKPVSLSINFISISGYFLKTARGKYADLVSKSQQKTAMEIMSLVCQGEFSSALKVISNQKETIDKIKEQFEFLANLATTNSSISIEPIFIKISSYNKEMGNWIISKLLQKEGTPTNASLVGKLIISDRTLIAHRLDLLLKAIIEKFEQASEMPTGSMNQQNCIKNFRQFVSIYVRSLRYAASSLSADEAVDLAVSQETLLKFISLLDSNDEQLSQNYRALLEFIVVCVVPPAPFKNCSIEQVDFATKTLLQESEAGSTSSDAKELITCFLAGQKNAIAMQFFNSRKGKLDLLLEELKKEPDQRMSHAKLALIAQSWLHAASDSKIKARLQEENIPTKIYQCMREESPKKCSRILKELSEPLLTALIDLLLKVTAGHAESEEALSLFVIEDIQLLATIRDQRFINKLLLSLIDNEQKLPVSFVHQDGMKGQPSDEWQPDLDSLSCSSSQKGKKEVVDYQKNFLPTNLLDSDQKQQLFKGFKEIVGLQSKNMLQKALNGKWTCIHSTSETIGPADQFMGIWNKIAGLGPIFILVNGNSPTKQNVTYGGFCQKNFPFANEECEHEADYAVMKSPGDFLFATQKDKGIGFYNHDSNLMIEVFSEYEDGGNITMGQDFFNISNSIHYGLGVGINQQVEPIVVSSIAKPDPDVQKNLLKAEYNFQLHRAEIWVADLNAKAISDVQESNAMRSSIVQTVGMQAINHKPHPWSLKSEPYSLFRSRPVFMVPSQIEISTLAEIVLNSKVQLKTKHNDLPAHALTVKQAFDALQADILKSESHNNILDLFFTLDDAFANACAEPEAGDANDLIERIESAYAKNCGFYESFQKNGGINRFIYVALVSLEQWQNQEVAKSWGQWLKDLDLFSRVPFFFQLAIKNKKYMELLMKIMAGQPDQDQSDKALADKWKAEQKEAVELNYKILSDTFKSKQDREDDIAMRDQALNEGIISGTLDRLGSICGEKPRVFEDEDKEAEPLEAVELKRQGSSIKAELDVATRSKAKRKGVGYSTKQGERFDVNAYLDNKVQRSKQVKIMIDIITGFINSQHWVASKELLDEFMESSLLPILEQGLRNSSLLELSNEAELYHSYLELLRAMCKQEAILPALVEIDKRYKPTQISPIYKLLGKLNELGTTFLSLNTFKQETDTQSKVSVNLAKDVKETYELVMEALEDLLAQKGNDDFIADALKLPLPQAYKALLEPLLFDKMSMKRDGTSTYNHKYKDMISQNQTVSAQKMHRLAQELADLSRAVPCENTNATFIRVDKDRVDTMKIVICGAEGTPYAHGAFEFDLFCDNNYPNVSPKLNLTTTGNGAIRFNPNLYACGKVCLSLLGTWSGKSTENWDPKISTILQVLMSTQSIIMSEEVYFNEPGFEQEAGTPEGERKNEGYSNIVRYGNVKYAMLGQLKNPSKGFETVIKRHFYLKKEVVLKTCRRWIERASKNEANYQGLVHDHNHTIAKDFQKSKTRYREALTALVDELEDVLNQLDKPTNYIIKPKTEKKKAKKTQQQAITDGMAQLNEVDMGTDSEEEESKKGGKMIDTSGKAKEIDVDDEAVKDRWSRYIGAMGVEAVAKQAAANIFISGAGALGMEISKNMVLSGCKSFTLHDRRPVTHRDLSGQFFLNQIVEGKTRAEVCMPRLQQLNYYVPCKVAPNEPIPHDAAALEAEPWNFGKMDVVILTEADYATAIAVNNYCRSKGKKFIFTQLAGVFGRVFNDFGDSFEVLDKNGEELLDVIVNSISNEEKGVVELLGNQKHKFEDGDEVTFTGIEGMKLKEGESHEDPSVKTDSINETIHKVTVINPYSFKIGDTRKYTPYEAKGIAKQLRMKHKIAYKSFEQSALSSPADLKMDENLWVADFEKLSHAQLSHIAFEALNKFTEESESKQGPKPWNLADAQRFLELCKPIADRYELVSADWKPDGLEQRFFMQFAFQAEGVFNPLAAFFGGFVAQEIVKAITGKFTPNNQFFYYDAIEVLPEFDPTKHISTEENKNYFEEVYVPTVAKTKEIGHRTDGLRICVGDDVVDKLAYAKIFMVGAGAIGCELLKNYAMLGVGTGKAVQDADPAKCRKPGSIVLTDPDIIEVSNLNRQFLFREKHLRKPKSQTAAAAAIYMNKELQGNIIARLDKVCDATEHIFTPKFFEDTTVVTNALDNVQARLYIDQRCVSAKTPLLESGTLGPKGHVQVILPNLTESYGSMADPEDNNEIPHCTLKMFPEETLHCVEWARDKFGKMFTQMPNSAAKILGQGESIDTTSTQDIISLREGLKLLRKRPNNFADCVEYARMRFEKLFNHDTKQLLHVYPLDAVVEGGKPFWTLPKRPPTPNEFDKTSELHCTFITSMACLRARMFYIEIPSKEPRSEQFRRDCGEIASQFTPPEFVPNEDKAKQIQQSVEKDNKQKDEEEEKKEAQEEEKGEDLDEIEQLKQEFLTIFGKYNSDKKNPIGNQEWIEQNLVKSDEFEKDNDANFHIDFMYSMGNCRAQCYKLEPMDWITVKLKAGRIVPALATTTASISGLQTLELVKILRQTKLADHRNIFLNLAVPMMQATEPAAAIKTKLAEGIEVNLWDRWEVKNAGMMSLANFIAHLEETYQGLKIRDVLKGSTPIYFDAIMSAPSKAQEKKKVMSTTLIKLAEIEKGEPYADFTITCVHADDPDAANAEIIQGVPPVRVYF